MEDSTKWSDGTVYYQPRIIPETNALWPESPEGQAAWIRCVSPSAILPGDWPAAHFGGCYWTSQEGGSGVGPFHIRKAGTPFHV
jgi:hypothetical protein